MSAKLIYTSAPSQKFQKMIVAIPSFSLVPDDDANKADNMLSLNFKLGDVTVIGRKDIDKSDSKLSKVSRTIF